MIFFIKKINPFIWYIIKGILQQYALNYKEILLYLIPGQSLHPFRMVYRRFQAASIDFKPRERTASVGVIHRRINLVVGDFKPGLCVGTAGMMNSSEDLVVPDFKFGQTFPSFRMMECSVDVHWLKFSG